MKEQNKNLKTLRTSYQYYKENVADPLSYKEYVKCCSDFNKHLFQLILDGETISLPGRMGFLKIKGKKVKITYNKDGLPNLAPDWKKTKELRASNPEAAKKKLIVYHTNDHTGGIRYKVHWSKKNFLKFKMIYSFRVTKQNKTKIARAIKNGKEYI